MSEDDKVVPLTSAPSIPGLQVKRQTTAERKDPFCKHWQIWVYAREPIIECKTCGAIVDPYQWLRLTTDNWQAAQDRVKYQITDMERERDELKKAVRLLRGEYKDETEKREAARAIMVMPPRKAF
jgi:hypothetical protein